jgi:hypothetical protein
MPIQIFPGSVVVQGHNIPFDSFPELHGRHLQKVNNTQQLEQDGARLIRDGFPFDNLEQFIRQVCRWGGYPGIAGRVLNRNGQQEIIQRFSDTILAFAAAQPAAAALASLNHLTDLGTPSFASKHLRFLRPDICPVLDRFLSRDLGYPFSTAGYQQMSDNCIEIGTLITNQLGPLDEGRPWGAADVEMSIFAFLHLDP